ncbi:hypothetical protein CLOM_g14331 [Closterium sp. NIES-68]|nr:hypothetical protein CLOM_g14331 [Closterium sp. NIES-68]GJP61685.1 hypothetical protein CLOP_g18830 [Closterium sp. NIES-67]
MALSFLRGFFKGGLVEEDLDAYYPVRQDVQVGTVSKFRPRASKRLSEDKWSDMFDAEGRMVNLDAALRLIQRGGCEPGIRPEVWEYLLGLVSPAATSAECGELRSMRREAYAALLKECQLVDPVIGSGFVVDFPRVQDDGSEMLLPDSYMGPLRLVPPIPSIDTPWEDRGAQLGVLEEEDEGEGEGEGEDGSGSGSRERWRKGSESMERRRRASENEVDEAMRTWAEERAEVVARVGLDRIHKWRQGLYQIGVDVTRADRSLLYFESSMARARLMNVLAVYAWFDPDVGYCQGMSDLMSPMVVLFPDDADAFWAFERLMRRVREDFMNTDTGLGIQREISRLSHMVYTLDPELHAHLDEIGAGTMFFTVRTVMAMFRRELSFADALYLWEMTWAWDYDACSAALLPLADQAIFLTARHLPHLTMERAAYIAATVAAVRAAASVLLDADLFTAIAMDIANATRVPLSAATGVASVGSDGGGGGSSGDDSFTAGGGGSSSSAAASIGTVSSIAGSGGTSAFAAAHEDANRGSVDLFSSPQRLEIALMAAELAVTQAAVHAVPDTPASGALMGRKGGGGAGGREFVVPGEEEDEEDEYGESESGEGEEEERSNGESQGSDLEGDSEEEEEDQEHRSEERVDGGEGEGDEEEEWGGDRLLSREAARIAGVWGDGEAEAEEPGMAEPAVGGAGTGTAGRVGGAGAAGGGATAVGASESSFFGRMRSLWGKKEDPSPASARDASNPAAAAAGASASSSGGDARVGSAKSVHQSRSESELTHEVNVYSHTRTQTQATRNTNVGSNFNPRSDHTGTAASAAAALQVASDPSHAATTEPAPAGAEPTAAAAAESALVPRSSSDGLFEGLFGFTRSITIHVMGSSSSGPPLPSSSLAPSSPPSTSTTSHSRHSSRGTTSPHPNSTTEDTVLDLSSVVSTRVAFDPSKDLPPEERLPSELQLEARRGALGGAMRGTGKGRGRERAEGESKEGRGDETREKMEGAGGEAVDGRGGINGARSPAAKSPQMDGSDRPSLSLRRYQSMGSERDRQLTPGGQTTKRNSPISARHSNKATALNANRSLLSMKRTGGSLKSDIPRIDLHSLPTILAPPSHPSHPSQRAQTHLPFPLSSQHRPSSFHSRLLRRHNSSQKQKAAAVAVQRQQQQQKQQQVEQHLQQVKQRHGFLRRYQSMSPGQLLRPLHLPLVWKQEQEISELKGHRSMAAHELSAALASVAAAAAAAGSAPSDGSGSRDTFWGFGGAFTDRSTAAGASDWAPAVLLATGPSPNAAAARSTAAAAAAGSKHHASRSFAVTTSDSSSPSTTPSDSRTLSRSFTWADSGPYRRDNLRFAATLAIREPSSRTSLRRHGSLALGSTRSFGPGSTRARRDKLQRRMSLGSEPDLGSGRGSDGGFGSPSEQQRRTRLEEGREERERGEVRNAEAAAAAAAAAAEVAAAAGVGNKNVRRVRSNEENLASRGMPPLPWRDSPKTPVGMMKDSPKIPAQQRDLVRMGSPKIPAPEAELRTGELARDSPRTLLEMQQRELVRTSSPRIPVPEGELAKESPKTNLGMGMQQRELVRMGSPKIPAPAGDVWRSDSRRALGIVGEVREFVTRGSSPRDQLSSAPAPAADATSLGFRLEISRPVGSADPWDSALAAAADATSAADAETADATSTARDARDSSSSSSTVVGGTAAGRASSLQAQSGKGEPESARGSRDSTGDPHAPLQRLRPPHVEVPGAAAAAAPAAPSPAAASPPAASIAVGAAAPGAAPEQPRPSPFLPPRSPGTFSHKPSRSLPSPSASARPAPGGVAGGAAAAAAARTSVPSNYLLGLPPISPRLSRTSSAGSGSESAGSGSASTFGHGWGGSTKSPRYLPSPPGGSGSTAGRIAGSTAGSIAGSRPSGLRKGSSLQSPRSLQSPHSLESPGSGEARRGDLKPEPNPSASVQEAVNLMQERALQPLNDSPEKARSMQERDQIRPDHRSNDLPDSPHLFSHSKSLPRASPPSPASMFHPPMRRLSLKVPLELHLNVKSPRAEHPPKSPGSLHFALPFEVNLGLKSPGPFRIPPELSSGMKSPRPFIPPDLLKSPLALKSPSSKEFLAKIFDDTNRAMLQSGAVKKGAKGWHSLPREAGGVLGGREEEREEEGSRQEGARRHTEKESSRDGEWEEAHQRSSSGGEGSVKGFCGTKEGEGAKEGKEAGGAAEEGGTKREAGMQGCSSV